ncbi:hypothetical protein AAFF_G00292650 [Aldrovandia affinis]|uniref:Uncharacterized protein n=1 Tax=Aldrovandia affinis TaxID=143900 RepID=A0AAD7SQE3_9TELE|nr:hypothetical protein AAFF_G00292650 [Aldrovandia affinis]
MLLYSLCNWCHNANQLHTAIYFNNSEEAVAPNLSALSPISPNAEAAPQAVQTPLGSWEARALWSCTTDRSNVTVGGGLCHRRVRCTLPPALETAQLF